MKGLGPALLWLALGTSACGIVDVQDEARNEYERSRERWEAMRPAAYVAHIERLCYCASEARGPVRVSVNGNTVLSRNYEASGEAVPEDLAGLFPTVDGLFDLVDDALDRGVHALEVDYDPATGAPFDIWIDYEEYAADEELGFILDLPLGSPAGS